MNITTKIILSFSVLILAVVLLSLYVASKSAKAVEDSVGKTSILLAESSMKSIDSLLDSKLHELDILIHNRRIHDSLAVSNSEFSKLPDIKGYILAQDREWVSLPWEGRNRFIDDLIENHASTELRQFMLLHQEWLGYSPYVEVFVTNKYGANVAQTQKTSDYYQADEEWWQQAEREGTYISPLEYDESAKAYSITLARRILDEEGRLVGVIKAVVDVQYLIRRSEIGFKPYPSTQFHLLTNDGKMLYSTEAYIFLEDVSQRDYFPRLQAESGYCISEEGGIRKLLSHTTSRDFSRMKNLPWIILVENDVTDFGLLQSMYGLRRIILGLTVLLVLLSLFIGMYLSYTISWPIRRLTNVIENISKGNTSVEIEPRVLKHRCEIGQLARAFERTMVSLKFCIQRHGHYEKPEPPKRGEKKRGEKKELTQYTQNGVYSK